MESTTYRGSASAYQRRPRASGATHLFEFHFLETKSSNSVSSKKRAARIWPASRAEKYASSTKATQSASVLSASFVLRIQGVSQRRTSMVAMRAKQNMITRKDTNSTKSRSREPRAYFASKTTRINAVGASNSTAASDTSRRLISGSRSSSRTRSKRPSTSAVLSSSAVITFAMASKTCACLVIVACVENRRVASTSTPSTRRLLAGVAMPVPHRSTEPARQRHRYEMT